MHCTIVLAEPSSNLGVIAPHWVRTPKMAFCFDVGKIRAVMAYCNTVVVANYSGKFRP